MTREEEKLRQKLKSQQGSHRGTFFFIYLCVGLFLLSQIVEDFKTWSGFLGSWVVVWLALVLAKKSSPDTDEEASAKRLSADKVASTLP